MKDAALDRLRADGFYAECTIGYATLYPKLREVARQHGYALALHGSLVKDLDVVAVPWTEDAADPVTLAKALTTRAHGFIPEGGIAERLHGRIAVTIHLVGPAGYIDLSIMPLAQGGTP